MPGGFPLGLELCNCISVADTSNSIGIGVNPSSSSNTKGSYVTLISATAFDVCWMDAYVGMGSSSGGYSIDIAVGPAGQEKIIVNNLFVTNTSAAALRHGPHYSFPVSIPAGMRISARAQCGASSDTGNNFVALQLFDGSFTQMEGTAGVDSISFNAGSTTGVTVTASGSSNTKGSYAQLIAATARDYIGLFFAVGRAGSLPSTSGSHLMDVAIGASGQEKIILPNLVFEYAAAAEAYYPETEGPYFIAVPAGTRLAARSQSDTSSSPVTVVAYGMYQ